MQSNNSISSGFNFGSIEPPDGMSLIDLGTSSRYPRNSQTIVVDTNSKRDYDYYIIVEVEMTKTSWAKKFYSIADAAPEDPSSSPMFRI